MISRFGATELSCLINYQGVVESNKNVISYITGSSPQWWWDMKIIEQMQNWSGFFPPKIDKIERFCQLMLIDMLQVDILGSWIKNEDQFKEHLNDCIKISFESLNPYFSKYPWTKALEFKKVLVVHPFATTIESQYLKRDLLFEGNLLPQFELKTLTAVQSIAGNKTPFSDWFEALEHMKAKIDLEDFDICLIGCGAYGFHLAAHVKRKGKKAIHLGGSLQLLFGIKGKRWENPDYNPKYNYAQLMNENWVYPAEEEKPQNASSVEGGCYW